MLYLKWFHSLSSLKLCEDLGQNGLFRPVCTQLNHVDWCLNIISRANWITTQTKIYLHSSMVRHPVPRFDIFLGEVWVEIDLNSLFKTSTCSGLKLSSSVLSNEVREVPICLFGIHSPHVGGLKGYQMTNNKVCKGFISIIKLVRVGVYF